MQTRPRSQVQALAQAEVRGIVELVGELIGLVMVPVDVEVNQVPDGEECAR